MSDADVMAETAAAMKERVRFGLADLGLLGLSLLPIGVGVHGGHLVFAVSLALTVLVAGRVVGFVGLFTATIGVLALASSSLPVLKSPAASERWAMLAIVAAWPLVSRRRIQLRYGRSVVLATLAFGLIAAASVAWSIEPRLTVERAATFLVLLWVALVVVPSECASSQECRRLLQGLAIIAVVGASAALVLGAVNPGVGRPDGYLRGWLENSNTIGIWCAALAPSLIAVRTVWVRVSGLAVVATAVLWSGSRSALAALLIACFVVLPLRRGKVLVTAGVVGLVAAFALAAPSLGTRSALSKVGANPSRTTVTGARTEAWRASLKLIRLEPLIGFGFGTGDRLFHLTAQDLHFRSYEGNDPANTFLRAAEETGVLGAAALAGSIAFALRSSWHARRDSMRLPFVLTGALLAIVALVESILTSAGNPFSLLAWASLGIASQRPHGRQGWA